MRNRKITIILLWITAVNCVQSTNNYAIDDLEDAFGSGAEDDEDNFSEAVFTTDELAELNRKSTRQDAEDVEVYLNSGPMLAPEVMRSHYVDSKVTLANMMEIYEMSPTSNNATHLDNPVVVDYDYPGAYDFIPAHLPGTGESDEGMNLIFNPFHNTPRCHLSFNTAEGSFNISFERDCTLEIAAPDPNSRIILSCSPITFAPCSTRKDSLSINLMGDMKFKTNSYMYCGPETKIKAISIRNRIAVKVKESPEIGTTSSCLFYSKKLRQFDPFQVDNVVCGKLGRNSKIVGGRRVPPGLFPWAAQLDITRADGSQTGCTGSVVSPNYILTAAHCMKRAEMISAFVGGTDRHEILGTEQLIQAEKYILHRKWSSKTLIADIALLKLTQPIRYSEDVSPICLPEGKLLVEDLSGRKGVVAGWGRVQSKQKAPRRLYRIKLPMLSEATCKNIYRRFFIPKSMMCTDSTRDAAICYGMTGNFMNKNCSHFVVIS